MKHYIFLFLVCFLLAVCGCGNSGSDSQSNNSDSSLVSIVPVNPFYLDIQTGGSQPQAVCGSIINISLKSETEVLPDSVLFFVDNKLVRPLSDSVNFALNTSDLSCGTRLLLADVYSKGEKFLVQRSFLLSSDIVPVKKSYKVIRKIKHDEAAYTQGLLIDDGFFYESTGLKGQSSLRKISFSGEINQSITLDDQYFGEGLALTSDDKLVQITWQEHRGFVYNKNTFEKISEFTYPTEGWGLVAYGDTLLLSDGTENIYFLDSRNFTLLKTINIFDNSGPVKRLNELEIVNGKLYANIYCSNLIAVINLSNSKVEQYIDLGGILPETERTEQTDVLNGIAYDKHNSVLYVTGKNWPWIYAITVK